MLTQCLVIVEIQSPLMIYSNKGCELSFACFDYPSLFSPCALAVLCAHIHLTLLCSTRHNSAYAGKKGIDVNSMRFMLDGEAVEFDSTPDSLDLEDNDQIDCFLQQVGGADDDEGADDTKAEDAPITIRVKDQTGEETMFKIKKSTKMKKVSV